MEENAVQTSIKTSIKVQLISELGKEASSPKHARLYSDRC